jgi:ribulose-phosphate 3-epimerase
VEAAEAGLHRHDEHEVHGGEEGFGGQSFRHDLLPKIAQFATWRRDRRLAFRLEVDGGIDLATAADCRAVGADTFVVGTSFFGVPDPAEFAAAFAKI